MKKWMYNTLAVIFAAVFLVSCVTLGYYYWDARTQQNRYAELSQLRPATDHRPIPDVTISDEETAPTVTEPQTVTLTNPKTGEPLTILAEFAQLYQLNSDIVGWMTIPAVGVDYPVMHTPENPEYYLRRNFDKEKNNRGCLFIQAECDVFAPSDNITIYGHHMRDDSMFGQLDKFRDPAFREENPYIYFDTLIQLHTYEIMCVFLTTATVDWGFPYHQFVDAQSPEAFKEFVDQCKRLSLYDTDVSAVYGDKLICLSTCEYSQTNGRLVVVAKQVA